MLKPSQPAGVFSSLVSHVVNAKFRYPKYVAQLASPAALPLALDIVGILRGWRSVNT